MDYDQFVQDVKEKVSRGIGTDITVCIHTAVKNNGRKRKGLMLTRRDVNISPAIYLEEYYEQYRKGSTPEEIASDILRLYEEVSFRHSWEGDRILAFEKIKERIIYRLVGQEKNKKLLAEAPYEPYLDMALVFYVLLEINDYGTAAMMIKKEHLTLWGMTKEQVYCLACRNTERLLPGEFQTMKAVIAELTESEEDEGEDAMYVLSNTIRNFGAAAIMYDRRLEHIGEYLREDYYVLPSSVHEVIIIPKSKAPGKRELIEMVSDINVTQVEEEDVLSDNAYYYDRRLKKLLE